MPFRCPFCGMVSHNPHDAEHHYCGNCHVFVDEKQERRKHREVDQWVKQSVGAGRELNGKKPDAEG